MPNPVTIIHMPYTQSKYVQNIVVNRVRSQTDSKIETLITLHIINIFLQNVVWDMALPKLLFYTKPLTSATESIFLSHAPTVENTPCCVSLPTWTLSIVLLLWLVNGLVDEALDGWEMSVACPEERHHHPLS